MRCLGERGKGRLMLGEWDKEGQDTSMAVDFAWLLVGDPAVEINDFHEDLSVVIYQSSFVI
ncbi:MAG TPA: hypothetical protein EYG57_05255 [Planctomycetes bacterium]|nr:hypothetical protein [Planctomycetota bacterium]